MSLKSWNKCWSIHKDYGREKTCEVTLRTFPNLKRKVKNYIFNLFEVFCISPAYGKKEGEFQGVGKLHQNKGM